MSIDRDSYEFKVFDEMDMDNVMKDKFVEIKPDIDAKYEKIIEIDDAKTIALMYRMEMEGLDK